MRLIVVGASWCRNCAMMRPRWQQVQDQTQISVEYCDFDQNPEVVAFYRLQNANLPACIFLDNQDNERLRLNGLIETNKLVETIKHLMSTTT